MTFARSSLTTAGQRCTFDLQCSYNFANIGTVFENLRQFPYPYDRMRVLADLVWAVFPPNFTIYGPTVFAGGTPQTEAQFSANSCPFCSFES